MNIYRGRRRPAGPEVTVRRENGQIEPLLWVRRHSATGFDWGGPGEGTLDLALSLLLDAVELRAVEQYYRDYAATVIARLPVSGWEIPGEAIRVQVRDYYSGELSRLKGMEGQDKTPGEAEQRFVSFFGLAKEIQALATENDAGLSIGLPGQECSSEAVEMDCVTPWYLKHPEANRPGSPEPSR